MKASDLTMSVQQLSHTKEEIFASWILLEWSRCSLTGIYRNLNIKFHYLGSDFTSEKKVIFHIFTEYNFLDYL